MADHPNVQRLRDGYAAFARGDLDTVKELWTDDVVWHVGGQSPLAGDYKGQDEIIAFFGKTFEQTGGTLQIDLHDVLGNDEHAVALVTLKAKRDGKSLEMNAVHVFELRDGKTAEFWAFNEDDRRADEFWE
ncbi:MAG TPA: nuclear transport factor 2 family protein [Actinomycetota bacterium]|jgi:ketosteroid isomerase-like protein|nr:nuclear transport factor 2 family protein [Actinomycetota bacterium]